MLRPGNLRHRIVIEQVIETTDPNGTINEEWVPYSNRWAEITPLQGQELFAAAQTNADITHRIRMRWLAGVVPKMRIKFGERIFGIDSVINTDERSEELLIMGHEEV